MDKTPVTLGLLAQVDAGKTTLAEALLYTSGKLRKMGRVDHKDTFLDTFSLERQRGITIFSKQAALDLNGRPFILLDTPGHAALSAETERTLSVLDQAVLIISATDGVSGHTHTLFKLLEYYAVPVFIFVNKMDLAGADKERVLTRLKETLSESCVDLSVRDKAFYEEAATGSEKAFEEYIKTGRISDDTLKELIASRSIFPVFFGSALRLEGIREFAGALSALAKSPAFSEEFGARVYKISRDEKGERLTHLKITGGSLKVKASLISDPLSEDGEKINQIRIYDGPGYALADEVFAGSVCAVTGPARTKAGNGFGSEQSLPKARLEPVLTYKIILPEGSDIPKILTLLKQLEDEDPQLHMVWSEASKEISVRVMGKLQLEILKSLIRERFGLEVSFGEGSIIYKETIKNTVEGVGHFEPLRHYAEVHLLLEPGERGSGMVFEADLSEDVLDKNWQHLIMTHLKEKCHTGILTGSELTDIRVTLKSGKAHIKHTEGGDFRQAALRALRQGLFQAENILLEPCYSFRLEVSSDMAGRAMSDIIRMSGRFSPPETYGSMSVITGVCPVYEMKEYPAEFYAYTHGEGKIFLEFSGYESCHNADEVIRLRAYCADHDTKNPASSIFCSHGSSYIVPWNEVKEHMHLASILKDEKKENEAPAAGPAPSGRLLAGENELKEIFERTYGSGTFHKRRSEYAHQEEKPDPAGEASCREKIRPVKDTKKKVLLVDGYNMIFAWDELKSLAQTDISAARGQLTQILSNYQAYRGMELILVFDGYKVRGNRGESIKYQNIDIIYTKEGESADQYIESAVERLGKKADVTVATSDNLEQLSVLSHGACRISAREFHEQIAEMSAELSEKYLERFQKTENRPFYGLSGESEPEKKNQ